jgi:hypothetical protein
VTYSDAMLTCRERGHDYGESAQRLISTCVVCGMIRTRTYTGSRVRYTYTYPPNAAQYTLPKEKAHTMKSAIPCNYTTFDDVGAKLQCTEDIAFVHSRVTNELPGAITHYRFCSKHSTLFREGYDSVLPLEEFDAQQEAKWA